MVSAFRLPPFLSAMVLSLMLAEVVSAFETSMLYSAMPTISRESGDPVLAGWLVTSYLLSGAVSAALIGRMGDLYGRRRVLEIVLALSAVGSLISAVFRDLHIVILGRGMQGLCAGVLPLAYGLVREHVLIKQVPLALSFVTMMAAVGAAVGLVLGGYLTQHAHWSVLFQITTIVPLLAIVAVRGTTSEGTRLARGPGRLDYLGGLLFASGVAAALIGISRGNDWGWASPATMGVVGIGFALVVIWGAYEYRHPNPMINVRLFAQRQLALVNLSCAALALGALQVSLVFVMLLQQPIWTGIGLGVTATATGLLKLPSNLAGIVGGPLGGAIASRLGSARLVAITGAACILLGFTAVSLFNSETSSVVMCSMVIMLGVGLTYAALPILIAETAPPERLSEITGMLAVVRAGSMAIGTQIIVVLLAVSTVKRDGLSYPSPEAFHSVFLFTIVTSLLSLLGFCFLPRRGTPDAVAVSSSEGTRLPVQRPV